MTGTGLMNAQRSVASFTDNVMAQISEDSVGAGGCPFVFVRAGFYGADSCYILTAPLVYKVIRPIRGLVYSFPRGPEVKKAQYVQRDEKGTEYFNVRIDDN